MTRRVGRDRVARDLTDPEVWEISQCRARAKRLAASRERSAGPVAGRRSSLRRSPRRSRFGGAHGRAKSSGSAEVRVEPSASAAEARRSSSAEEGLGIMADGDLPRTRAAVRAFQKRHGLLVDGIVGPQTRGALYGRAPEQKIIRAWWVVPVQRALGCPSTDSTGR